MGLFPPLLFDSTSKMNQKPTTLLTSFINASKAEIRAGHDSGASYDELAKADAYQQIKILEPHLTPPSASKVIQDARAILEALPDDKNFEAATRAKEAGNAHFLAARYPDALAAYSESICLSPFPSKSSAGEEQGDAVVDRHSLALAFGNRSAVLFRQARYAECVRDVDDAVSFGYPQKSLGKLLVRKVRSYVAADRPDLAVAFLSSKVQSMKLSPACLAEYEKELNDVLTEAKDKV